MVAENSANQTAYKNPTELKRFSSQELAGKRTLAARQPGDGQWAERPQTNRFSSRVATELAYPFRML